MDLKLAQLKKERLMLEANAIVGPEAAAVKAELDQKLGELKAKVDGFEAVTGKAANLAPDERQKRAFVALRAVVDAHYPYDGQKAVALSRAAMAARLEELADIVANGGQGRLTAAFEKLYEAVPEHVLASSALALTNNYNDYYFNAAEARQAIAQRDAQETMALLQNVADQANAVAGQHAVAAREVSAFELAEKSAFEVIAAVDKLLDNGDATPAETVRAIEGAYDAINAETRAGGQLPARVGVLEKCIGAVLKAARDVAGQ